MGICKHGGEIFSVRRRVKWPGLAAVVVSVLHVAKGSVADHKQIDGRSVERITAFLFHRGGHDDPVRLAANAGKSFQGSIVLGMGFTFDDTDLKGAASPLAEMRRLIDQNPRNQEVVFPYIGGRETQTRARRMRITGMSSTSGTGRYGGKIWASRGWERTTIGAAHGCEAASCR